MARVLVTGASGFVGNNCLSALRDSNHEVIALSRKPPRGDLTDIEVIGVDLFDAAEVSRTVAGLRATHLLHLAWLPLTSDWASAGMDAFNAWISASADLVRAFADGGGRRVVAVGTCAEYRWDSRDKLSENGSVIDPATSYGQSKVLLHQELSRQCNELGLSLSWARLFSAYGPYEHARRLVPAVVRALLSGEVAQLSHGMQVKDYAYAGDLADGLLSLLVSDLEGAVNLASGHGVRVRDVATCVGDILGCEDLLEFGAIDGQAVDGDYPVVADISLAESRLDWRATTGLREGLEMTVDWWRREIAST